MFTFYKSVYAADNTESTKLPNAPACKAAQSMLPTCKNREYDKTIERKW